MEDSIKARLEMSQDNRLETPRRYIVKSGNRVFVAHVDNPKSALSGPNDQAKLMGTHETESDAKARLGW